MEVPIQFNSINFSVKTHVFLENDLYDIISGQEKLDGNAILFEK